MSQSASTKIIKCAKKKRKKRVIGGNGTFLVYPKGLPMAKNVRGHMRLHAQIL